MLFQQFKKLQGLLIVQLQDFANKIECWPN